MARQSLNRSSLFSSSSENISSDISFLQNGTKIERENQNGTMDYSLAYSENGDSVVEVYNLSSKLDIKSYKNHTHGVKLFSKSPIKKILWYDIYHNGNGVRNKARKVDFSKCEHQCVLDFFIFEDVDKIYAPIDADAILMQLNKLQTLGHPPLKRKDQVFVAVEREATPTEKIPLRNFENMFNWTMTYRRDSDIFYPYGRIVKRRKPSARKKYSQIYKLKKKSVIWFVSHCNTKSKRENYVEELKKYIDVDIYGKCGTLQCARHGNQSRDCLPKLEEEYFFRIAFENTYHSDYVTEKLYEHFPSSMIQIVDGSADYRHLVPERTVVNARDFGSPKELSAYLKSIESNEKKYIDYIQRKDQYYAENLNDQSQRAYCQLCSMLHNPEKYQKFYYNVGDWWDC